MGRKSSRLVPSKEVMLNALCQHGPCPCTEPLLRLSKNQDMHSSNLTFCRFSGGDWGQSGFVRRSQKIPGKQCQSRFALGEKHRMPLVNIPIDITEVADDLESADVLFSVYDLQELRSVPPFDGMKPGPENFPGSMILRRCEKGRILCRQGERGATAFQILTRSDALNVLQAQLRAVTEEETAVEHALQAESDPGSDGKHFEQLQQRRETFRGMQSDRVRSLTEEINRLKRTLQSHENQEPAVPREVVHARLLVASSGVRKGLVHRLLDRIRGRGASQSGNPAIRPYIPNDGPQDLSGSTLSAPMCEGDLFGEMSCMNLAPRSATVIVTEGRADDPVYIIEMVRNALDALRGNADYRKRIDETYRKRVMEMQVRSLPLFQVLTDDEYKWLADKLELVEFKAGDVIFDEHDSSADCCYVVRSGVVKVSQNLGCLLGESEFHNLPALCRELAACSQGTVTAVKFWSELTPETRVQINTLATAESVFDKSQQDALRQAINKWIQTSGLHTTLGQKTADVIINAGLSQHSTLFEDFQEKTADWWELEVRIFNRVLLESFCPQGIRKRAAVVLNRRTLSYPGRGEIIGEIALLRGDSRSATCLAFTHPSSGQKTASQANLVPQRVEAVRIGADILRELIGRSTKFKVCVNEVVQTRMDRDRLSVETSVEGRVASQTKEFDALGLAWGQSLMVIDLDRCTRCQECVKACVNSHDDGRTRLYLDGPRFENKYLIPVTCRKCLDPVCMIGCPVAAINRGASGEIQIADHCIGCSKCADQCPYGSIQMDLLDASQELSPDLMELLGPGYMLRTVQEKAVVCDQCSSTPSGEPSCVYACPHDAAIRVQGLQYFNQ